MIVLTAALLLHAPAAPPPWQVNEDRGPSLVCHLYLDGRRRCTPGYPPQTLPLWPAPAPDRRCP